MYEWTATMGTGTVVKFKPELVTPLGFQDLKVILDPPVAQPDAEPPTHALELYASEGTIIENGETGTGEIRMKARVGLDQKASIFALVTGGWIPPCFCPINRFLVDRNVISLFKWMVERPENTPPVQREYWLKFFADPEIVLNPLPFAFEGHHRRRPTKAEFMAEFEEGRKAIKAAMPAAQVTQFETRHFDGAYGLLESLERREKKEIAFLLEIAPFIRNRPSAENAGGAETRILEIAKQHGIAFESLVVIAALACIYEGDTEISPARRVLKPSQAYNRENAYNALADLRHLELKLASAQLTEGGEFALCTADEGLALFWCSIPCDLKEDGLTFKSRLTLDLFPRLGEQGLTRLGNRLAGR